MTNRRKRISNKTNQFHKWTSIQTKKNSFFSVCSLWILYTYYITIVHNHSTKCNYWTVHTHIHFRFWFITYHIILARWNTTDNTQQQKKIADDEPYLWSIALKVPRIHLYSFVIFSAFHNSLFNQTAAPTEQRLIIKKKMELKAPEKEKFETSTTTTSFIPMK